MKPFSLQAVDVHDAADTALRNLDYAIGFLEQIWEPLDYERERCLAAALALLGQTREHIEAAKDAVEPTAAADGHPKQQARALQ